MVKQNLPEKSFDDDADKKQLLYYLDTGAMEISWREVEEASEFDNELSKVRDAIKSDEWDAGRDTSEGLRVFGSMIFRNYRIVLRRSVLRITSEGYPVSSPGTRWNIIIETYHA